MDYLQPVARPLCDERDWLLMIDEVQCGMGRTGKWFATSGRASCRRDAAGQGLGSGRADWRGGGGPQSRPHLQPGNHGTTFGGNPLAMRAGVETIRIMEEDGLLANAASTGAHLKARWARTRRAARVKGHPGPGPDAGHGAGAALRRAGNARRRSRLADQRHGRQRDPAWCRR